MMKTRLDENLVRRCVRVAPRISSEDWQLAERFYPEHAALIAGEADAAGIAQFAAMDASARLSVRTSPARELDALNALLNGKRRPAGILRANWRAARVALREGLDAALKGDAPKVRCYRAATGGDESRAVIDVHIARFLGVPHAEVGTAAGFERCERVLQAAARRLGVAPRTLQAAIWYHVRGVKPQDRVA